MLECTDGQTYGPEEIYMPPTIVGAYKSPELKINGVLLLLGGQLYN